MPVTTPRKPKAPPHRWYAFATDDDRQVAEGATLPEVMKAASEAMPAPWPNGVAPYYLTTDHPFCRLRPTASHPRAAASASYVAAPGKDKPTP